MQKYAEYIHVWWWTLRVGTNWCSMLDASFCIRSSPFLYFFNAFSSFIQRRIIFFSFHYVSECLFICTGFEQTCNYHLLAVFGRLFECCWIKAKWNDIGILRFAVCPRCEWRSSTRNISVMPTGRRFMKIWGYFLFKVNTPVLTPIHGLWRHDKFPFGTMPSLSRKHFQ